jgi:hypothetical protein
MKSLSKKCVVSLALSLASASGMAAGDNDNFAPGAGAALYLSKDNEGFFTQRTAVEYLPRFKHGESLTGVRYTGHYFKQGDWSRSGEQLTFLHRDIEPATANGWQLDSGLFHQGGHDLLTADGNCRAALAERTALEVFVNRDWVETANALDKGVHFTYAGGGVEQGFGPHVTVIGLAGYQSFSDANSRNHGRIRLIIQPDLDLGLTLQARYRVYTSSSEDVGGAYFNPSRYDEAMLAIGWRQRLLGWTTRLTAGAGRQHVADDPSTPTRLLEIGAQSPPIHAYSIGLRGGFNQSASFNGPDYRYRYLQGELIVGF